MDPLRLTALLLTVATGFTGLVYEVTWQRVLATLLGSHSEASAALLGIFLAGLSLGYSLFGSLTRRVVRRARQAGRPPRLLLLYGCVEGAIGVYALFFPLLFRAVQALSLAVPHGAQGLGFAFDVGLTICLVAPSCILMGGTIPVLTQALSRSLADATRFHALVYALNTAGAFAGALAAGFFLLPGLGLVASMLAMGVINVTVGVLFALLGVRRRPVPVPGSEQHTTPRLHGFAGTLAVALLSGFAMMVVQTVLLRLGALAFGSSEFTFSTVVAVFVLCIALGSFGVSLLPRVRGWTLVANQAALALYLVLLYPRLAEAPYWIHLLRVRFPSTDEAFTAFYLAGLGAILVVVGPPVILSGATLPLLFHQMRSEAGDLGALAGRIYSWNTVGSLLGALLGGYALLFWLDLHQVYRLALAAMATTVLLLAVRVFSLDWRLATAAILAPAFLGIYLLEPWNPKLLAAGLFRRRTAGPVAELPTREALDLLEKGPDLVFYEDDPTASVAVRQQVVDGQVVRSIVNNGKSDGSTKDDYTTMMLCAILPALLADRLERVFVIGYGTGITAGEFAALDGVRQVDVAEISPGVLKAAYLFDFASLEASRSPKVNRIRSDAYRALLRSEGGYDAISSEPSNPWVTGVEMLYSREFLAAARRKLAPGGVYVQWYHLYETDRSSVELVLRTFADVFDAVAVWYSEPPDLLLVGLKDGDVEPDLERMAARAGESGVPAALARAGIAGLPALLAHELLPMGALNARGLEGPVHTLMRPLLSYSAGRAFYRGARASLPFTGGGRAAELGARNSLVGRARAAHGGSLPEGFRTTLVREACRHPTPSCAALLAAWLVEHPHSPALRRILDRVQERGGWQLSLDLLADLAVLQRPPAEDGTSVSPARAGHLTELYERYYHHAAPFRPESLRAVWRRCAPASACRAGTRRAQALLDGERGPQPASR